MHRRSIAILAARLIVAVAGCVASAPAQEPVVTTAAAATATEATPPAFTATLGPPTATATITPTATDTPTATATPTVTPTLALPDDAVGRSIYGVVVGGTHPWLRSRTFPAEQAALRRLYEPGGLAPVWVRDGRPTEQAGAVIAAFAASGADGLSPADYDASMLREAAARLAAGTASREDVGLFDSALSVGALRFVSDSTRGRVRPRDVGWYYDVAPKLSDPAVTVAELAASPDPAARLAQLNPPSAQYANLRAALGRYRELAAQVDLATLPRLPKLTPGDRDPGVPALRAHLAAHGDLGADAPAPPAEAADVYDESLADAVRRFQRRHGLAPDAVIGPATQAALRVPLAQRAEQIALAMERLRWLPYEWPDRFIIVNIPEFRLRGYAGGAAVPALEMNVVVGQADRVKTHKTPALQADMEYVVFRPYWMVPSGIARKELWPKIERDPGYLARNNYEVRNGRIRQRPGRGNSLGMVKFIFPNPHHVYLHDTPSKGLFARARRDFSHGCVRVADPPTLAEFVLADTPGWDRARIERAMRNGPNDRRAPLATPIPVYLFYTTAVADEAGGVHFFDDIYGHDASLQRQLTKGIAN